LQREYFLIATRIGHHILSNKYPGEDVHGVWNAMSPDQKVEAFKLWLGEPENNNCLFIVDDLDKLRDVQPLASALPSHAKNVFISTRRPNIVEEVQGKTFSLRLNLMTTDEIVSIMNSLLRRYEFDCCLLDQLKPIAEAVHGHPLAASNAIKYIVWILSLLPGKSPAQRFIEMMNNSDYDARRRFLDYKPPGAPSIMETYLSSQLRLRDPSGEARQLFQRICFLETDETVTDFRTFLFTVPSSIKEKRSWFRTASPELLAELESVSFGLRGAYGKGFQIHPLWVECARHLVGHDGRVDHISHVVSICYDYSMLLRDTDLKIDASMLDSHIDCCLRVCRSFNIDIDSLRLGDCEKDWLTLVDWRKKQQA
jgi:hypothetical protein